MYDKQNFSTPWFIIPLPLEDFRGIGKCLGNVGCPRFRHEPSRDIPIPKTVATASSSFFSFGIQRTEKEERREKRKKREKEEERRRKKKRKKKKKKRRSRRALGAGSTRKIVGGWKKDRNHGRRTSWKNVCTNLAYWRSGKSRNGEKEKNVFWSVYHARFCSPLVLPRFLVFVSLIRLCRLLWE